MSAPKKQKTSTSDDDDSEFRNLISNFHNPALSAQTVAENQEILTHILDYLPIKSVVQFKCVSKLWCSFISNCIARYNLSKISKRPSDLFLIPNREEPWKFKFLTLQGPSVEEYHVLDSLDPTSVRVKILHFCNGLTLYRSKMKKRSNDNRNVSGDSLYDYFVCNTALKKNRALPSFSPRVKKRDHAVFFSFDPFVSPYYTVVCASPWRNKKQARREFEIEVYTSQSRMWSVIEGTFTIPLGNCEDESFFRTSWNGWIFLPGSPWGDNVSYYLDTEAKIIGSINLPSSPTRRRNRPNLATCRSSLYLIDFEPAPPSKEMADICVYEMKRNSTDWSLNYKVDREAMQSAFPLPLVVSFPPQFISCVSGEDEDDVLLILEIPCRIIAFSVKDKSWKTLFKIWLRRPLCSKIGTDMHILHQTLYHP